MTQGGQSRLANRRPATPFNPVSSMALIVQKYGGTSVGDIDRIKNVAQRIKKSRDEGHGLVVVVSARSGVTNELIAKAKALTDTPNTREMDMLLAIGEQETIALTAMALHAIDIPAVSYTGAQAGIFTDQVFTKAKIKKIIPKNIQKDLKDGKVIIVAGFQGINEEGQITTLGRGGSDLTAIALAAALKADKCEIYTDVDGVYTADPRIVKTAQKLEEISYDEMLELASLGSKVMQSRSVEFAKKYGVVFEVRSSFNHNPGTIVKEEVAYMEKVVVRGVAVDKDQAKVAVTNVPDKPATAAAIFKALADANINVDMIVQNTSHTGGLSDLTFTVQRDDAQNAVRVLPAVLKQLGGGEVKAYDNIAKLSVVGVGMRTHAGVAATLFTALGDKGLNIQLIATSEIKITVAVDRTKADEAVRVAHAAFGLDK
jgi:aspartate kinase